MIADNYTWSMVTIHGQWHLCMNDWMARHNACMHDFTKAYPVKLNILSQEDLAIAVHQKFACSKVFSFVSKIVDELAKGLWPFFWSDSKIFCTITNVIVIWLFLSSHVLKVSWMVLVGAYNHSKNDIDEEDSQRLREERELLQSALSITKSRVVPFSRKKERQSQGMKSISWSNLTNL